MKESSVLVLAAVCIFCGWCDADTFTHRQSGQVYHGYATSKSNAGITTVKTTENGQMELNLAEYDIQPDQGLQGSQKAQQTPPRYSGRSKKTG